MFIKPCTSPFFLPLSFFTPTRYWFSRWKPLYLLVLCHSIPGHFRTVGGFCWFFFFLKTNAFYKRFSSLFHMQLPLGATVKFLWMQHSVLGTSLAYIIRKHCCLNLVQTDDFNSQEVNVLRSKACCSFFIASQTAGPFRAASAQLQNVLSCLEPFQSIWTFISFHGNAEWRCWQTLNTLLELHSNSQPSFWGRCF